MTIKQDSLLFVFSDDFVGRESSVYNAPLVLMSQPSAPDFWLQVKLYYTEKKSAPNIIQIVNEFHSAIAWAATGQAVTIIPRSMISLLNITHGLNFLPVEYACWDLGIMWRPHTHRKALNDFIDQFKCKGGL